MSTSFDPEQIEAGNYGDPIDETDGFEIAEVRGFDKTADQIEEERSFDEVPPGEWKLYVSGFLKAPERVTKDVYLAGRRTSYTAYSVIVKLARADAPGQQVTDYFLLPPDDPNQWPAYFNGAKNPDGKGAGFDAAKFYHFLERIGYAVPKGGALPADARKLTNWKRREVIAKVEPGRPYLDQTTGIEKPGRNQIKLFSYRPAGSGTPAGAAPEPAASSPASSRRAGPSGQQQMANAGLDNI